MKRNGRARLDGIDNGTAGAVDRLAIATADGLGIGDLKMVALLIHGAVVQGVMGFLPFLGTIIIEWRVEFVFAGEALLGRIKRIEPIAISAPCGALGRDPDAFALGGGDFRLPNFAAAMFYR